MHSILHGHEEQVTNSISYSSALLRSWVSLGDLPGWLQNMQLYDTAVVETHPEKSDIVSEREL